MGRTQEPLCEPSVDLSPPLLMREVQLAMARRRTNCRYECLKEIDSALVEGAASSEIAAKYRISDDVLSRQKANHLPDVLVEAQGAMETLRADHLLSQVRELQSRTLAILEAAHERRQ